MTTRLPGRTLAALLCVTTAGLGASTIAPADAGPVASGYSCSSPSLPGSLDINFGEDTTAPATVYVGRTVTPTLKLTATIPGNIVGLAATFGVKSASATGTYTIEVNQKPSARPFVFPRTDIPQTSQDFPVKLSIGLAPLTRSTAGTVTYTPGPVAITLTGYKNTVANAQPGDDVGSVGAQCTSKTPKQKIDVVTFVRSATTLHASATYARATKALTTAVDVVAKSGLTPTGKVTAALYRGKKKLTTRTVTLSSGRATVGFAGVAKHGAYHVLLTYGGSRAMKGSTAKRAVSVR